MIKETLIAAITRGRGQARNLAARARQRLHALRQIDWAALRTDLARRGDATVRFVSSQIAARRGPKTTAHANRGRRAAAAFAGRLTLERITKRYGPAEALRGVSLDIAPGELVCLLGPSGCGKTSLLRIASGVDQPTAGRVLIDGREVAGPTHFVPPEKRNVGLMFQDFALFPHLTVHQNVAFGLKALPREVANAEAHAILSRVGLESFADAYPDTLSGGQQQRVALARAIAPRPSVLLMDEPFSGLDVQLRDEMQEQTLALLKETRATAVMVTHAPSEAMRMGDRIAVMRAGLMVQVGTAEQLYRAPADLFVARLFSAINEVRLPVVGGEIDTPFGRFDARGLADGVEAVVCIRHRAIRFVEAGAGVAGRVLRARFQGDLAVLELGVQGLEPSLRAVVREADAMAPGTDVAVAIDRAGVLVFDGADGAVGMTSHTNAGPGTALADDPAMQSDAA